MIGACMPPRSRAPSTAPPGPPAAAPFPRAAATFAGRRAELARILGLLDEEIVFLVYGVGGIGKTELGYKVVEEARARAPWRDAAPVHLQVLPDMGEEHLLALLRLRLDRRSATSRATCAPAASSRPPGPSSPGPTGRPPR
jgi:hypothetical protein